MNIFINGIRGKMGKVLKKVVLESDEFKYLGGYSSKKDEDNLIYDDFNNLNKKPDVIIDFSNPKTLDAMLDYALKNKIPLVIATTGYNDLELEKIKKASNDIPICQSYNMSLGINTLIEILNIASTMLSDFDIEIIEKHHNKKIDSPSGTAIMLANKITDLLNNRYITNRKHSNNNLRNKEEIAIHAIRGGSIFGEHNVLFAGDDEVVEIKHSALSKDIFAKGSLKASLFLSNKNNGFYTMKDILGGI